MSVRVQGYLLALLASVCYGLAAVLIRQGVIAFDAPLVGSSLALAVGLVSLAVLARLTGNGKRDANPASHRSLALMFLSGICSAVGLGGNYVALSLAPVVIVTPIAQSHPLVTITLSRLFFQKSERVNARVIIGGVLAVGGIILIALGG